LELWPENLAAVDLFMEVSTQWRVGMSGPTGLDYAGVLAVMEINGIAPEDRRERLQELRVMERAALDVMSEQANTRS